MNIPTTTHAFAALTSINAGDWDDVLPQLRIAVRDRMAKTDYKQKILARAEFRAGDISGQTRE